MEIKSINICFIFFFILTVCLLITDLKLFKLDGNNVIEKFDTFSDYKYIGYKLGDYKYESREDAKDACQAEDYDGLCKKDQVISYREFHDKCEPGWTSDSNPGYYMVNPTEQQKKWKCDKGWNNSTEVKSGAYCCNQVDNCGKFLSIDPDDYEEEGEFLYDCGHEDDLI